MRARNSFHAATAIAAALAVAQLGACSGAPEDAAGAEEIAAAALASQGTTAQDRFAIRTARATRMQEGATVAGGDVGVAAPPLLSKGYALRLDTHAAATGGARLISPSVFLSRGAVAGEVLTRRLQDAGSTHGAVSTFTPVPPIEPLAAVEAGTVAVIVPPGAPLTLPAGAYGDVTVEAEAVLWLEGGEYALQSLRVAPGGSVVALATARVRVATRLDVASETRVGPAEGAGSARDLRIEVAGVDASSGRGDLETDVRLAARIGERGTVRALISIPSGGLVVGPNATVTGAVVANEVLMRPGASILFEDGFGEPACTGTCDDSNACTLDACVAGTCRHEPAGAGMSCSDGDACNGEETCDGAGTCLPGVGPVADDGNPCTQDACDPSAGVVHLPVAAGTSCANANACDGAETCDGFGGCAPGPAPAVDDGNPCTADACDPALGVVHAPLLAGALCSDGNPCNGLETCSGGLCLAGPPPSVEDGNPCTADACDPTLGAVHAPVAAGVSCSDANACNGVETCDGQGTCVAGAAPALDDGNRCTADACDPLLGVVHAQLAAGVACSDGNLCNGTETCDGAGACVAPPPTWMSDGNPCTMDVCDPLQGAMHIPIPGCIPPPGT